MKKAILIGNGVTSQLIPAYRDLEMIACFKSYNSVLYEQVDALLQPYRALPRKDESSIIALLKMQGIEAHHYYRYFVEQGLLHELEKPHIIAIETLLKVAHLFHHVAEIDYNKITAIANIIYYNNGNNGAAEIKAEFPVEKFIQFINSYQYVFTTNFDNILDDTYQDEVMHLHGGFYYRDCREDNLHWVEKSARALSPKEACLIWGRNAQDKEIQQHGTFSFPIKFPFKIPHSVLDDYMKNLTRGDFETLEIWGYSGLNDRHINSSIQKNPNICRIIYYRNPSMTNDTDAYHKARSLFCNDTYAGSFDFVSWDTIWNNFI